MSKNYYEILGVPENASKDDIKKAFRTLAKKHHPDRNKGDKTAEARFKDISEAYDVLGDDSKRRQYDDMRRFGGFGGAGFDPRSTGFGPGGFGRGGATFNFENLQGFGSFADIFSSIFGGEDVFAGRGGMGARTAQTRRTSPKRGNNWSIKLNVAFDEAVRGAIKTLVLHKPSSCKVCGGSGNERGSGQQVCTECGGRGVVVFGQGGFSISRPCPKCFGKGTMPGQPCRKCGGRGIVREKQKVKIKIPAGIDDGGRIRLRGMGYPGENGGQNGDLIITVSTEKHQEFKREGKDIYTNVEITFPQAVLGAKVPVNTLAQKINLTIPPGTEHGTVLRLKGLGLAVEGTKGDQFVTVHIKVPKKVTDKQRELLEELAETL